MAKGKARVKSAKAVTAQHNAKQKTHTQHRDRRPSGQRPGRPS